MLAAGQIPIVISKHFAPLPQVAGRYQNRAPKKKFCEAEAIEEASRLEKYPGGAPRLGREEISHLVSIGHRHMLAEEESAENARRQVAVTGAATSLGGGEGDWVAPE